MSNGTPLSKFPPALLSVRLTACACSLVNSNDARKGSLLLNREDSLDNLSTDEAKAEQLDAKGLKSKLALVGLQNETLLDPIHRPIWVESKDAC